MARALTQVTVEVGNWVGRGMGSPIPSPEEGAWVREDSRVVGGGLTHFGPLISSTWNHEGTWLRHTF